MSKVKKEQIGYFFLAAFVMAGAIMFVKSGAVLTAVSTSFTGVVGVFLGLDLAKMIADTRVMPEGKFKQMNKHRYVMSLVTFSVLLAESFILGQFNKTDYNGIYASFGVGFMVVVGAIIGGIEGNKIVTKQGPKDPSI